MSYRNYGQTETKTDRGNLAMSATRWQASSCKPWVATFHRLIPSISVCLPRPRIHYPQYEPQLTTFQGNHTAYKQWQGRRVPADEVLELYEGLEQSNLHDFDMMLSGYAASKEVVEVVGKIGRELRDRTSIKPGSFFWSRSLPWACREPLHHA